VLSGLLLVEGLEDPLLEGVRSVARSHLKPRAVLRHLETLVRDHVKELILLVVVFPVLVALHAVAGKDHHVLTRVVDAGLVSANLAVFAEHPVLQEERGFISRTTKACTQDSSRTAYRTALRL